MKIEKILNNNFIVVSNEGNECVVSGKGIAFKKHVGDSISMENINRIYKLSNSSINDNFQQLVMNLPMEYVQIADKIIDYAKLQLGDKLNENIILSLSDHIHVAIKRFLDGLDFKNAMLWDIKRFFEEEFKIGLKALDFIEEQFKVRLPDDEAGFIALHIVNSEMDENIHNIYQITKIMQEISNIVKYHFSVEFNTNSVYHYRFITHLKFFAQRLIKGETYDDGNDNKLFQTIKSTYKSSFECVETISEFLLRKYQYVLSNEEKLYLTIHIERVIYKNKDSTIK